MTIKHRIERLEKEHIPTDLSTHLINCEYGESKEHAKQRYCDENGMTIEELENLTPAPWPRIIFAIPVKPGDIK